MKIPLPALPPFAAFTPPQNLSHILFLCSPCVPASHSLYVSATRSRPQALSLSLTLSLSLSHSLSVSRALSLTLSRSLSLSVSLSLTHFVSRALSLSPSRSLSLSLCLALSLSLCLALSLSLCLALSLPLPLPRACDDAQALCIQTLLNNSDLHENLIVFLLRDSGVVRGDSKPVQQQGFPP